MPSIAEIIAAKNAKKKPLVIGQTQPVKPVAVKDEPRALSMTEGESLDLTPVNADELTARWHSCLNAFETELCVMRDPRDSERAWLALRLSGREEDPLLLKSFMLFDHPRQVRQANEPF